MAAEVTAVVSAAGVDGCSVLVTIGDKVEVPVIRVCRVRVVLRDHDLVSLEPAVGDDIPVQPDFQAVDIPDQVRGRLIRRPGLDRGGGVRYGEPDNAAVDHPVRVDCDDPDVVCTRPELAAKVATIVRAGCIESGGVLVTAGREYGIFVTGISLVRVVAGDQYPVPKGAAIGVIVPVQPDMPAVGTATEVGCRIISLLAGIRSLRRDWCRDDHRRGSCRGTGVTFVVTDDVGAGVGVGVGVAGVPGRVRKILLPGTAPLQYSVVTLR